jgi:hypothetical protein
MNGADGSCAEHHDPEFELMAGLRRFTERVVPYVVALPVGVVAWNHPLQIPVKYHADVITSSLSMAAIFLGFLSTSLGILISYQETRVASELRSCGAMKLLVSYIRQAILWTLLWLIVSFLLFFWQSRPWLTLWISLGTLALMCFLRVTHLLSKLIMQESRKP